MMKNLLHEYLSEIVGGLVVAVIIYGVTALRDVLGSLRVVMLIVEVVSFALFIYVMTVKQKGVVYPHQSRPRFSPKAQGRAKFFFVSITAVIALLWLTPMAKHENEKRIIDSDKTLSPTNSQGDSTKPNSTHDNEPCIDFPEEDLNIYEEQIRRNISEYLKMNDVEMAMKLWQCLRSETAKDEECGFIFDHCLKNGKLDKAEEMLKCFRLPSEKKDAQRRLAHEKFQLQKQ